jgi:hypothetical protein
MILGRDGILRSLRFDWNPIWMLSAVRLRCRIVQRWIDVATLQVSDPSYTKRFYLISFFDTFNKFLGFTGVGSYLLKEILLDRL